MLDRPEGDLAGYLLSLPDAKFANWTVSLPVYWMDFGGTNNMTTRLRKSPGRRLLRQFTDRRRLLRPGASYDITLVQNGHWIEYWVEGEPWIRMHDPRPLTEGHIGFRAYLADLKIEQFKVWRIE
jgi:hypothetical protein